MTREEIKDLFAQEIVIRLLEVEPGPDMLQIMHTLLPKWLNTYENREYSEEHKTMLDRHINL